MASDNSTNGTIDQRPTRNQHIIYYLSCGIDFNGLRKMASAKLVWIILDIFGLPIWMAGIATNIDNWKALVLFAIGCIYGGARIYYYIRQREQAMEEKELELRHKRMDYQERINGKK